MLRAFLSFKLIPSTSAITQEQHRTSQANTTVTITEVVFTTIHIIFDFERLPCNSELTDTEIPF